MSSTYAILLAGGQGSRFWPQSRTLEPKQFLCLHKDATLFEQTISRIKPLVPARNIIIATSELYRSQLRETLAPLGIPEENIIFESEGKNTAPSIAAACRLISLRDADARICVLPCDHLIANRKGFITIMKAAFAACAENLVVFGIPAIRPATGYGYIKISGKPGRGGVSEVERFCEKPDRKTAEKFIRDGGYFWNSGIFVGAVSVFMDAFKRYQPELYRLIQHIDRADDLGKIWKRVKPISFDYGILEKTRAIRMIRAKGLGWSDLGSWQAWDEVLAKNGDGNCFKGDVINIGSRNTTAWSSKRLIATVGLEDVIVVETPDAVLITRKGASEDVKRVVDALKSARRDEHYYHRTVKRPWGSYTVIETGTGFKVKTVEICPGKQLSLQLHRRRSEHWVVVEGTAKIVKGRRSYYVKKNESTFIPIGCEHRIINPTGEPLKIVEVQSGQYLEEDDIVRLKDDFGRA